MSTRDEIEAAERLITSSPPDAAHEGIYSSLDEMAEDAVKVARAYLSDRQQRERDQQPPTREMFERLKEQTDSFDWCKDVNNVRWYFDGWYLDLDTIAKLRAACLLLGIETDGIL